MLRLLASLTITAGSMLAAGAVGTVTGSGPFLLSGTEIPAVHAASIPLVSGDVVSTSGAPVILNLRDHSRVLLDNETSVRIEGSESEPVIRLLKGSLTWITGTALEVYALGRRIKASQRGSTSAAIRSDVLDTGESRMHETTLGLLAPLRAAKKPSRTCPDPKPGFSDPSKDPPDDNNCGRGNGF